MGYRIGRCLLKSLLQTKKMTQQELADKTHLSRQRISDYANNRITMSYETARNIASYLGCYMEDLYE